MGGKKWGKKHISALEMMNVFSDFLLTFILRRLAIVFSLRLLKWFRCTNRRGEHRALAALHITVQPLTRGDKLTPLCFKRSHGRRRLETTALVPYWHFWFLEKYLNSWMDPFGVWSRYSWCSGMNPNVFSDSWTSGLVPLAGGLVCLWVKCLSSYWLVCH